MVSPVKIIPDYSTIQIPRWSTARRRGLSTRLDGKTLRRGLSLERRRHYPQHQSVRPRLVAVTARKRYRDWKKWGHGHLNVTKALEESADTYFYQVAYDMGIDRLSEWMSKFGYGDYTGVDRRKNAPATCQLANGSLSA